MHMHTQMHVFTIDVFLTPNHINLYKSIFCNYTFLIFNVVHQKCKELSVYIYVKSCTSVFLHKPKQHAEFGFTISLPFFVNTGPCRWESQIRSVVAMPLGSCGHLWATLEATFDATQCNKSPFATFHDIWDNPMPQAVQISHQNLGHPDCSCCR